MVKILWINIKSKCIEKGIEFKFANCSFFQHNNEGDLIDHIHSVQNNFDGLNIKSSSIYSYF